MFANRNYGRQNGSISLFRDGIAYMSVNIRWQIERKFPAKLVGTSVDVLAFIRLKRPSQGEILGGFCCLLAGPVGAAIFFHSPIELEANESLKPGSHKWCQCSANGNSNGQYD